MEKKLERRDKLARERTFFAIERTLLAHIRTALACFLFGIVLIKLFEGFRVAFYFGILSLIAGIIFLIIGIIYYPIRKNRIKRY